MNKLISLFILIFFSLLINCGNEQQSASSNVTELSVDFVWKGMESCGKDNPKFDIKGIPPNTKFIKIDMKDKGYQYDNKSVQIPFDGNGDLIGKKFKEITTPCPGMLPGDYKITIEAIGENGVVLATASKERNFPEN